MEIPKHGEDGVEDNQGFQPEQVYRMEEKHDRKKRKLFREGIMFNVTNDLILV